MLSDMDVTPTTKIPKVCLDIEYQPYTYQTLFNSCKRLSVTYLFSLRIINSWDFIKLIIALVMFSSNFYVGSSIKITASKRDKSPPDSEATTTVFPMGKFLNALNIKYMVHSYH